MTNREQLLVKLKQPTRRYETVTVPSGELFTVRSLSMKDRGENDRMIFGDGDKLDLKRIDHQQCDLLCRAVVDKETKEPLLSVDEWELWQTMNADDVDALLRAIEKVNGKRVTEQEILGNSSATGD